MSFALKCLFSARPTLCSLLLLLAFIPAQAAAKAGGSAGLKPVPLLPQSFAGWRIEAGSQSSASPRQADAANSDVLSEYGFQQFEAADYRGNGNTLTIRAMRFRDASGAYGAFTFYQAPNSLPEQIGRGARQDGSHVLFWAESTLVDAKFGHLTATSAAQLRRLAQDLPHPADNDRIAPVLPSYLPSKGLVADTTRYTLGPAAYARSGGVLPPTLVDFTNGSAEAVTAAYNLDGARGELTLLNYPTPQLAEAREKILTKFLKAGDAGKSWPRPLADSPSGSILIRRSGPFLAILSGDLPSAPAHKLIDQVKYSAGVVWNNPQGYVSEGAKLAHLLVSVIILAAILCGASILLGLFLGGGRAMFRILRGKPASSMNDEDDFIRLKLDE